jgi:transcriptional regulator with XRE-family HTH domain
MDHNLRDELGKRIKFHRERLKMTQTDLAKAVKKSSPAFIAFIESGDRSIGTFDLILLAKVFGITVSELVGEAKPAERPQFLEALRSSSGLTKKDRDIIEAVYKTLKENRDGKNKS